MKYNASLFESIKNSLANQKKSTDNGRFKDILKFEVGKSYIVRILPNVKDADKTFYHYFMHTFKSNLTGKYLNILCPNTYEQECPIDEFRSKVYKTKNEKNIEAIKPLARSENWIVNVYVVKDPTNPENNGQVKLLRYGKQLNKIIEAAMTGDDADEFGWRVLDPSSKGCNLKIKVDENEGGFATYTASRFQSPSALEGVDEEEIDELLEKVQDVSDLYTIQSYDEIQAILNKHWLGLSKTENTSNSSTEEEEDEAPVSKNKLNLKKDSDSITEETESTEDDGIDEMLKDLDNI